MNYQHFNQLSEIVDSLEPAPEYKPMLTDALQNNFSLGAARHLQRQLLARYQAKQYLEKAIELLSSEQPEV